MKEKRPQLDLNRLGGFVRQNVHWPDVRNIGVVHLGDTTIHVIDTQWRAVVVTFRAGQMNTPRFAVKSFDDIMRRFARLLDGRPLLSGRVN